MAAAAHRIPSVLKKMLSETVSVPVVDETVYELQLADSRSEYVLKSDVIESRNEGYDASTGGLWVAAVMRGFAQAVLRAALAKSVDKIEEIPDTLKPLVKRLVQEDKFLLQAYDVVVRGAVDPKGKIDRAMFKKNLKKQLERVQIPAIMADILIGFADDSGFLEAMETVVQQNGDVFGAYRSIGNGGFASRAVKMLFQMECTIVSPAGHDAAGLVQKIKTTLSDGGLAMISTGAKYPGDKPGWFVQHHAYAILDVDGDNVLIRNPWASTPKPFKLAGSELKKGFDGIDLCK